jgi:outer membrane protein assembly factor BamE
MNKIKTWGFSGAVIWLAVTLASCSSLPRPYKLAIEQGNDITQQQVAKLKPGMNKGQVSYLLGTPLLQRSAPSPWIYLYTFQPGYPTQHKVPMRQQLNIYFNQDIVSHFEWSEVK